MSFRAVVAVPAIADRVSRLFVFQRSPNWFFPKLDPVYPAWLQQLFRLAPVLMTIQAQHNKYRWLRLTELSALSHQPTNHGIPTMSDCMYSGGRYSYWWRAGHWSGSLVAPPPAPSSGS